MKQQKGFGIYGLLAVVVIAGLLGFSVWRITSTKEKEATNTTSQTAKQETKEEQKTEIAVDPTADWQSFTDPTYKYTIKYPKEWLRQTENTESCSEGIVLLAPTKESLGRCATDFVGRVMVIASKKVAEGGFGLTKAGYPDLVVTDVFANGVKGKKYVGTSQPSDNEGIGPVAGAIIIHYVFEKDGKEYALLYAQEPSASNEQAIVELMATKGFTF